MGLRINSSTGPRIDADLGSTFAKALFGDVDQEIKLARLRDDQAMDEYQKRQYSAATNLNIMNTAIAAAKARDAEWELGAKQGGVGPGAKLVLAAQEGGTGSVQPAEQPAVVETPAEPPAPSLPYQSVGGAGAYPVVASDVEPVPVVPGHVATSPAAAAPEVTPPAPEPPVPSIIRLPDDGEPDIVEDVPPALQPVTGSSPDAEYLLGQRGEGYDNIIGPEGELPVVIDGDSPSAHSIASITNTSDTDTEEPPTVAAAAQPVSATAATAPASVGSAPAPTAPADANPKPATPGPQPDANAEPVLPNTAPVPQQKPEITPIPGTDKVVVKDPQGRVKIYTQADAEAAVAAIIANGGDIQGGIGKLGGQLGILTDPTLTPAQKEAILMGHLPGKDSILGPSKGVSDVGDIVVIDGVAYTKDIDANGNRILSLTPGGPQKGPEGPYQSKSAETDYQRIIDSVQTKYRTGQPITPEEASQYDRAVTDLYGTKYEFRAGPDETTIRVPIDPARPLVLASPTAIYKSAGVNAPQPPAPDKTVQTTDANGNPVVGSNVPAGGANTDDTDLANYVVNYDPLSDRPIEVAYKGNRKMTELENKNTGFFITSARAAKELDKMTGADAPNAVMAELTNPANVGGWQGIARNLLSDPATREYWVNTMLFSNAVLRSETGAATRPEELALVMTRFIPQRGDDARVIELKRQARGAVLEAQRRGALGDHPSASELERYANDKFGPLPARAAPASAPAPATAPATAPDTAAPATPPKRGFSVDPKTGRAVRN